jgi:cation diffusion facilitator family transporter
MAQAGDSGTALAAQQTALLSLVAAGVLVVLKLGVGIATGSLALVSAGVESSGDVGAAVITFFAVRLGRRPADPGHPYGHRRAENLGALGESAILLAGGIVVSVEAIEHLIEHAPAPSIHWFQFAVLGVAFAVDVARIGASLATARRTGSTALRANALHFAGDMLGTLAVVAGLLAVRSGATQADSVAALVVAAIIFAAAVRLIAVNANVLMDRAPSQARGAAARAIADIGEDIELGRLRLRESAGRYFADVIVRVPPGQALVESHRAADLVEAAVEDALPGSDVVVHVEPRRRGLDLRDRVLEIALSEPLVKEAHDIEIYEQGDRASVSLHLKFPAELDLHEAHDTAERIEQRIRSRPEVIDVQTHLEPLERPLGASESAPAEQPELRQAIEELVRGRTGAPPRRLRLLSTDGGRVVFLTLDVPAGQSLAAAHTLAGELEDELRQRVPGIAEVVVHTEP